MKVFTFFYREVVIQILTEIVPYLQKICTVTESKIFAFFYKRLLYKKTQNFLKLMTFYKVKLIFFTESGFFMKCDLL